MTTEANCCLPAAETTSTDRAGADTAYHGGEPSATLLALPGGWFQMGADDGPHLEDGEGPQRDVFVDPFSIAATAISIADYSKFVAATGYRTLAERVGNSFVFHAFCDADTSYHAPAQAPWWRQVPGACWNAPEGSGSSIEGREDHPVTHIGLEDAVAYCNWSKTRLPTEAEWEYAARGNLVGQPFPWGGLLEQDDRHHSNVWQGEFPHHNSAEDGYAGTAPVTAFEPNGLGLFNMTGNSWEWVSDRFTTLHSARPIRNPKGPLNGSRFVAKGGSYLCHASYCARYRTSSRQSLAPDTSTGNLGFRVCR